MTYRNLFFNLLIAVFISPYMVAGMMMPNMEDFEKELAEANRAIEEYVASLPPAEQEEFNRQVEDMSRMFENMSEDEFEKFLGEMFADEPMMEQNPFEAVQPTPQEVVPEVVLSAEDKKKVETVIAILEDIIKQSNLFMVIINSASDLPERINQWAKKGRIANWQNEADWTSFKLELESFVQRLYRIQEQDLTTKKYKYLFELIADEALYNNLIELRTELKNVVPTIDIPEFSVQKLSDESKTAIQTVLAKYAESFYLLGIPKSLDTLFEKYAPEEEKIRAAEEAATKRAQELARMGRTPAAQTEAGVEEMDYGYGDYYGGGYDSYYPYSGGYDYRSPYGYDYGYSPDYGSSYGGGSGGYGSGSGSGRGESSGGSGSAARASRQTTEEEEKTKDEKDKKEKRERFTPNYELDTAVRDIKKDLEEIKSALSTTEENPTKLANLVQHITKEDEKIDEILAGYVLPRVLDKKLDDIESALKKIAAKELNQDDLTHYQKEVKKLFDDYKKELDTLLKSINSFEEKKTEEEKREAEEAKKVLPVGTEEEAKKKNVETLSPAKQWAYFGGSDSSLTSDEDVKLKETITPVSLFIIRDKITKLLKSVKSFEEKKAKAPKKPVKKESAFDEIPSMPSAPAL